MTEREFSGKMALAASRYGKERDYWLNKLAGQPIKARFPYDTANTGYRLQASHISLKGELFEKLMKVSKNSDYTLHMVLTAGLTALLGKYTASKDILMGMPIYNQEKEGEFLNTALAIRNRLEDTMSFKELLIRVRQTIIEANRHQNYPLETLLYQLEMTYTGKEFPLFEVVVLLENIQQEKYIRHTHPNVIFSFLKKHDRIEGKVQYNAIRYHKGTIERITRHYTRQLEQAVINLEKPVLEIDILSEKEKEQLLGEFNRTSTPYPADKTIDELYRRQAGKTPNKTAVVDERETLTYEALDQWSHKLAVYLQSQGLRHEEAVGIMAENNVKMIIGILGILKAGGAYLPLNSEYPEERRTYLQRDGNVKKLLITTASNKQAGNSNQIDEAGVIHLGNRDVYPQQGSPTRNHTPHSLAYIIYTSGSTGKPKGTMVPHRGVVRLVKNTNYIEFRKSDRLLQTGALDFDASTLEIWGALLNGLQLYLAGKEAILTPGTLKEILEKNQITTTWMTSSLFNQLLEEDITIFKGHRNLLVGGEVLSPTHIHRVRKAYPHLKVINGYGPTENTTFSLTHLIEREYKQSIPIGKPIANSTAYIIDGQNHPAPIGVPGELCVGGDGLSRGYLNNPELTAEKFLTFSTGYYRSYMSHMSYIYRTGDLARWQSDGNIDFLGRIDHQIKIRGYRIEPGEIETQLVKQEAIQEAVVVVRGSGTEKHLCAYIVTGEAKTPEVTELKHALLENLPDYMIPAYIVQIAKIPLTANGKIDKDALPAPEIQAGENYTAPGDNLEKALVETWSQVLGVEKDIIGIDTDFFDLGGHSLKATLLIAGVHKELQVKIPLVELFRAPTVREMAAYLKTLKKDRFLAIQCVEKKEYHEPASVQKRLYVLQQMKTGGIAYNVPMAAVLEGELNTGKLGQIFRELVKRHESIRTSFEMIAGEPVQRIHPDVNFEIESYNIATEDTEDTEKKNYKLQITNIIKDFIQPFDLSRAPLLRVGLIKQEEKKQILIIDIHHIVTDGTSMGILVKEFMTLYGGKELPEMRVRYKDFSGWQNKWYRTGGMKSQEAYWKKQYENETIIPVTVLPYDFPRPGVYNFAGSSITFEIGSTTVNALNRLALQQGATLYMVLVSIFNVLLAFLQGRQQEDILIGTPVTGRRHAHLERVVGMFVNTLVIRNSPHPQLSYKEFLHQVKEKTLETFENQDYPFEHLVDLLPIKRDTGRNPLFDVMLVLQNMEYPTLEIPGMKLTPIRSAAEIAKFDLTLIAAETADNLLCIFEYNTRLFKKETVVRFSKYFQEIITSVLENPAKKIGQIEIIPEAEKQLILYDFNDTAAAFPGEKTLHQLFHEQVEKTPDNIALQGSLTAHEKNHNKSYMSYMTYISYKELDKKANQLSHLLRKKGVKTDTIVGMMLDRTIEMIIAMLGILKAGGAYLPIDINNPGKRIRYILKEAGIRTLVEQGKPGKKYSFVETIDLEDKEINSENSDNPTETLKPRHLLYVIYTSGTTGQPKGAAIRHQGFINMVYFHHRVFGGNSRTRVSQSVSPGFDAMAFETWPCLLSGAALYIAPDEVRADPKGMKEWLIVNAITRSYQPTIMARQLLQEEWQEQGAALEVLQTAGDRLTRYPDPNRYYPFRFYNLYGPTESTVWATWTQVTPAHNPDKNPSIGKPIANLRIYIVGPDLKPRPIGAAGELSIAGIGLAAGYINQPEQTAEKFCLRRPGGRFLKKLPPWTREASAKNFLLFPTHSPYSPIYKTGDLAAWLPDGNIEFLSRIDHQVKIRGYRIELEEIQSHLEKHDEIEKALVIDRENKQREKYLSAYIVPVPPTLPRTTRLSAPGASLTPPALKEFLARTLPGYMIPTYFTEIEKIPLTLSGKIDRNALPEPTIPMDTENHMGPRDKIERKLLEIWAEILGIEKDKISTNANFFQLGGHSIKAANLVTRIQNQYKITIPLVELIQTPFIQSQAEIIREGTTRTGPKSPPGDNPVLLKPGTAKTHRANNTRHLYFIHDSTGQVEGYLELCKYINNDMNLWGFRAQTPGNPAPRKQTIQQMARDYIEKMKHLQPQGPYYIAGWSLGGIIAFEIARQLEQEKEKIEFLGLIDAPPPNHLKVGGRFRRTRLNYNPKEKIETRVYYFAAAQSKKTAKGKAKEEWNNSSRQPILFYEIPGDHFSIMQPPAVKSLADLFREIL